MYEKFGGAGKYISGLKLFADGALGARSAALSEACAAGNVKHLLRSAAEMDSLLEHCAEIADNIAVHAIGDAAVGQVLDSVKNVLINDKKISVRIEHAQMITAEQAVLAKKLGVKLSMQPNFSYDSVCYADRLSDMYIKANNPFRMIIDTAGFIPGTDLIFGSDGMPHGAAPALESSLNPPIPSQRLNLDEFIAGYCVCNRPY